MSRPQTTLAFFAALASFYTFAPDAVRAAAIDSLTMTPNGSNTDFVITGTYPSDTPVTGFSSPNSPYTLNFSLPTSPTSFAVNLPDPGLFGLRTTVTLNGTMVPDSMAAFFTPATGGGVDICIGQDCGPDVITPLEWVVYTSDPLQLFTGQVTAPTFVSGSVTIDQTQSFINVSSPVPEPSTLGLVLVCGAISPLGRRALRIIRSNRTLVG